MFSRLFEMLPAGAAWSAIAVLLLLLPVIGISSYPQAASPLLSQNMTPPTAASAAATQPADDSPLLDDDTGPAKVANVPGLPRLARVTRWLYRGGEPTQEGLARLKEMGIRTIIDVQGLSNRREEVEAAGMYYLRIPLYAWNPSDKAVIEFLKACAFRDRGPFYVHCWLGTERTAFMTAIYRMVYCGWTRQAAINEMLDNDYNEFMNQQQSFAERIDVQELRSLASVPDNEVRPPKN
jgi:protein tyrosine phosphatase (PTP) superfamily phosphohydrolase (DUF442 family)